MLIDWEDLFSFRDDAQRESSGAFEMVFVFVRERQSAYIRTYVYPVFFVAGEKRKC